MIKVISDIAQHIRLVGAWWHIRLWLARGDTSDYAGRVVLPCGARCTNVAWNGDMLPIALMTTFNIMALSKVFNFAFTSPSIIMCMNSALPLSCLCSDCGDTLSPRHGTYERTHGALISVPELTLTSSDRPICVCVAVPVKESRKLHQIAFCVKTWFFTKRQ